MKLRINVDPAACFQAGIEPAATLDVDLAQMSPEDRALVANVLQGDFVLVTLATPTIESLVAAARNNAAREAKLREQLAARRTLTRDASFLGVAYEEVLPDIDEGWRWIIPRNDLRREIEAWNEECQEQTKRNRLAAAAVKKAETDAGIAARAAMTHEQLLAALPTEAAAARYMGPIISDDGREIVLAGAPIAEGIETRLAISFSTGKAVRRVVAGGEEFECSTYKVEDGVMNIANASWIAKVEDPSAVKPRYEFLSRCPGGWEAPNDLVPGNIIVWGGRDKKARKTGPFDRLVYEVNDTVIKAIRCDYVTARKLRKALVKREG
jgi:hypothetical protein